MIFVTDGDPTVGETDHRTIIENAVARNRADVRIFAFGVESAVDGVLLNNLAAKTGGTAARVERGDELDDAVGALTEKIARPVLADLAVRVEGGGAYDLEPHAPPDLFAGGQVRLVGRYAEPGPVTVTLTGTRRGRAVELKGTFDLPGRARADAPLRRLWAKRRIAFLQDELWWRDAPAAHEELKYEIVRLSLAERILTPYTAMLVLETDDDYRRHGLPVPARSEKELAALDVADEAAAEAWSATTEFEGRIADDATASGPRPVGGGTMPSPSSGPKGGPSAPGAGKPSRPWSGAPSSPGAGPPPGGGGGGPRGPVTSGGGGGKKCRPSEGFEQWPFWWEHNRDAVLVRTSNHAGSVPSGGAAFLSGLARRETTRESRSPTTDEAIAAFVPVLRGVLGDADADVVDSALMALGKIVPADRGDLVLDDLVAGLSSPHVTVRHAAILSLGVLGSVEALPSLHAMLKDRSVERLEAAFAAASVGAIGAPESVDVLFDTIRAEPKGEVDLESMVVLALGQFEVRRDEIVAFLSARLTDPSLARTTAAQIPISLARLGGEAREALPQLVRLAAGRKTDVRMVESCVLALGSLADPDDAAVFELLMETIRDSKIEQARHFAFIALAELTGRAARDLPRYEARVDEVIAFLSAQLERPRAQTHQPWAATSLALIGRELGDASSRRVRIITTLIEAFEDSNHPIYRSAFATGLGLLEAHAAGEMLLDEFEEQLGKRSRSDELCGGLATALGLLRTPGATATLLRWLDERPAPRLSIQAVAALGRIGDPEAVAPLVARLRTATALNELASTARALGDLRDRAVAPRLVELIEDESASGLARAFACVALGRLAEK
ncbi:MAG: HEAT repeat domain-containing protein, partial [Planctomycetota bacterium JB042]